MKLTTIDFIILECIKAKLSMLYFTKVEFMNFIKA